ncbi:MAG: rod shape-determining protein RodA [Bacteroidaceae bacterium]|nr:rod shape-determining protein RodA [Bacteroidaceae bacterium]
MDWLTILLYVILLAIGWMSICGACYDYGETPNLFALSTRSGMQIVWIGTSMLLGAVILLLDDRIYDTFAYIIFALLLALLIATPFLAHDIKGSHSWIKIGPFSLQSAEFAKFATALAIAKFMSSYGFQLQGSWRNFLICCAFIFTPMVLIIMQKETGSALVYFSFFLMLYREGMPGSILFAGIAAVAYVVVGLRYADQQVLGDTTSLGTLLVLAIIHVFVAALLIVYTSPKTSDIQRLGEQRTAAVAFRQTMTATLLLTPLAAATIMGADYVMAHIADISPATQAFAQKNFGTDILPFDAALPLTVVLVALALRLIWIGFASHIYRYAYIALFALGSMAVFFSAHTMLDHLAEHQRTRVQVLLGLKDDPKGAGYNVIQAQIAIGSGGLEGKGFLNGTQTKLKYVPEQETDFIFCTVGEEQGFIGSAAVLGLFLLLLLRLIHLAERQTTDFGRIYIYCVFSIFLFHVVINVGMVLGLMPVIGIPLPFFSYGGSSLWGFTILLFIALRIDAARPMK